jgi:hypothetical protein
MTHLDYYHTSHMRTGCQKTINDLYVQSVHKVPTYLLKYFNLFLQDITKQSTRMCDRSVTSNPWKEITEYNTWIA